MLKNKLNSTKLKNFFKSGMFGDFFLKKIVCKFLLSNLKFTIFFLEKFILDFIPKNMNKLLTFNTQNNFIFTKFFGTAIFLINLLLVLFAFSIF